MAHLLTFDEWRDLTRMSSQHIDEEEVEIFIEECEDVLIVPALGVELYNALVAYANDSVVRWDEAFVGFADGQFLMSADNMKILLDGGQYQGDCGALKVTKGIRKTLAYYVYAKVARNDGAIVGRSGFLQHTDERAQRLDDKQKVNRYNDIMSIAESYLSGCLGFVMSRLDGCAKKVRGKRTTIKAIGD